MAYTACRKTAGARTGRCVGWSSWRKVFLPCAVLCMCRPSKRRAAATMVSECLAASACLCRYCSSSLRAFRWAFFSTTARTQPRAFRQRFPAELFRHPAASVVAAASSSLVCEGGGSFGSSGCEGADNGVSGSCGDGTCGAALSRLEVSDGGTSFALGCCSAGFFCCLSGATLLTPDRRRGAELTRLIVLRALTCVGALTRAAALKGRWRGERLARLASGGIGPLSLRSSRSHECML
jgi:hypothetical protein